MRLRYLDATSSTANTASLGFGVIEPRRHGDNVCPYPVRLSATLHSNQLKVAFVIPVVCMPLL